MYQKQSIPATFQRTDTQPDITSSAAIFTPHPHLSQQQRAGFRVEVPQQRTTSAPEIAVIRNDDCEKEILRPTPRINIENGLPRPTPLPAPIDNCNCNCNCNTSCGNNNSAFVLILILLLCGYC